MSLLSCLYAIILRLYPPDFRREFAEEMQDVFSEALQEAAEPGGISPTRLLLRELADLPANLVSQFWNSFYAWVMLPWQDHASFDAKSSSPGSWLNAGLAGLPHLLFALALYLPQLVAFLLDLPGDRRSALPVFWVMTALALIIAQRQGWPRWSSSWIGYALAFFLDWVNALPPSGLLAFLAGIAWLWLAAILLFWLARRDWVSGLLAVLPVSPIWIWLARVGYPPGTLDSAALFLSISLLVTGTAFAIVRLGRWQTALLLILVVILATGMPDSYGSHYSIEFAMQPQSDSVSWSRANGWMTNYTLMLVFTAPLWLMAVWRQAGRRRLGGID